MFIQIKFHSFKIRAYAQVCNEIPGALATKLNLFLVLKVYNEVLNLPFRSLHRVFIFFLISIGIELRNIHFVFDNIKPVEKKRKTFRRKVKK